MKDNRKTLVLFDIGAVLLKLDYNSFFEKAAKIKGCSKEEFAKLYNQSNIEFDSLIGNITYNENLERISNLISPNIPLSEQEVIDTIKLCWPEEISDVVNLKKRVFESGYSIGLFSNMSNLALNTISKQWPDICDVYDKIMPTIYSFQINSVKPQLPMYQEIKGYEKVIFIDDKESYLRTGIEQFGWIGIHFTPYIDTLESIREIHNDSTKPKNNFYVVNSVEGLEKCLKKLKVNISST